MGIRVYQYLKLDKALIYGLERGNFTIGSDYGGKKFIAIHLRPEDDRTPPEGDCNDYKQTIVAYLREEIHCKKGDYVMHSGFYQVKRNGVEVIAFYEYIYNTFYVIDDVENYFQLPLHCRIDLDAKFAEDAIKEAKKKYLEKYVEHIKYVSASFVCDTDDIMKLISDEDINNLMNIKNRTTANSAILQFVNHISGITELNDAMIVAQAAYTKAAEDLVAECAKKKKTKKSSIAKEKTDDDIGGSEKMQ